MRFRYDEIRGPVLPPEFVHDGDSREGDPMSSKSRTAAAQAAITALIEAFPAAFTSTGRRPLKLGIHDDLLARGIAADVATKGLAAYCTSTGYLTATKAGAPRIDLDGNAAGTVTAEEAEHAVAKLAAAAERAKVMLANAAKAAEEQARAAEKGRAATKAPVPARAEQSTASHDAGEKRTGQQKGQPAAKRAPVVVVRKTRRPGR
jgi:ProP effector